MTATDWQPGDPLHPHQSDGGSSYRRHVFNFRDDSDSDFCHCPDAASWPSPRPHHDIDRQHRTMETA